MPRAFLHACQSLPLSPGTQQRVASPAPPGGERGRPDTWPCVPGRRDPEGQSWCNILQIFILRPGGETVLWPSSRKDLVKPKGKKRESGAEGEARVAPGAPRAQREASLDPQEQKSLTQPRPALCLPGAQHSWGAARKGRMEGRRGREARSPGPCRPRRGRRRGQPGSVEGNMTGPVLHFNRLSLTMAAPCSSCLRGVFRRPDPWDWPRAEDSEAPGA